MADATKFAEDLVLARNLAKGAAEVALRFFDEQVDFDLKPDGTEVTPADFEVERFLVEQLGRQRPRDGVLGVISRPVLAQHWWAIRGGGAYKGSAESPTTRGIPIRVSNTPTLSASAVAVWAEPPHVLIDRVQASATLAAADLDAILRLAEGGLDAVIDPTGRVWDHAPAVVLVEEAGGKFSDAENGRRIDRGEGRYTNGLIHEALLQALAG